MLIVSLIYAVAINFDKMMVTNSDPVFGSSITCIILGLSFAGMSRSMGLRDVIGSVIALPPNAPHQRGVGTGAPPFKKSIGQWILIGMLLSVSAVSINTAYTMQIVPYVIAIKRMSIILMVLYGASVFKEEDVARRLSGSLLMVAGAVLIVLFS